MHSAGLLMEQIEPDSSSAMHTSTVLAAQVAEDVGSLVGCGVGIGVGIGLCVDQSVSRWFATV